MIDIIKDFFQIGISGFLISIVTFFITKMHYRKQIADQIYIGPLLTNVYKPLITEFKRVTHENSLGNSPTLNIKNIHRIIAENSLIINSSPRKIKKKLDLIYELTAKVKLNSFENSSIRILNELKHLQHDLEKKYKEFSNE